jgi:hypothetical protein
MHLDDELKGGMKTSPRDLRLTPVTSEYAEAAATKRAPVGKNA